MISIIIPTLNEEKVLEKTLKMLKGLNLIPHEVIISDGRSKDGTIKIANELADKVVVYEGEKRQTIAMGRNLGASVAQGEYLVFLDADMNIPDINKFFKKAIGDFEKNPKLTGLGVFLGVTDDARKMFDGLFLTFFNWMILILNNILHMGAQPGEFQMVRTDTFRKLNGYNETLAVGEDNEFFSRLSKVGQTRIDRSLVAEHPLRRAHKFGWPKLIFIWGQNYFSTVLFNKSYHEVWEEIR